MALRIGRNQIIAHHMTLNGYGTWLSNDIRGSGSYVIRKDELEQLGPIHHGRKAIQPSRRDLKSFHRAAEPLLDFKPGWFDSPARDVIAKAVEEVILTQGYTCYAFCVCSNHVHLLLRRHRDPWEQMWDHVATATRVALRASTAFKATHPVWAARPYNVFKRSPREVETAVDYVDLNPDKEGLPRQYHPFVKPYDGWPYILNPRQ